MTIHNISPGISNNRCTWERRILRAENSLMKPLTSSTPSSSLDLLYWFHCDNFFGGSEKFAAWHFATLGYRLPLALACTIRFRTSRTTCKNDFIQSFLARQNAIYWLLLLQNRLLPTELQVLTHTTPISNCFVPQGLQFPTMTTLLEMTLFLLFLLFSLNLRLGNKLDPSLDFTILVQHFLGLWLCIFAPAEAEPQLILGYHELNSMSALHKMGLTLIIWMPNEALSLEPATT